MNITKKELGKSEIELTVELLMEEFQPHIDRGVAKISEEVKLDGFRPGKGSYDVLKAKIGEIAILEEAANIAISKTIDAAIEKHVTEETVGRPAVSVTKLAPGNPLEYKVVLAVLPAVTLGSYQDLKVVVPKEEVTEKEVVEVIEYLRESRVAEAAVERESQQGDKVTMDINMYLDKVPVEGGLGKGVAVIIGKNYVVPGFDKEVMGLKKGETKKFDLLYPEKHHMANLAGKMVEFEVKVLDIFERILKPLDDEFAKGFGLSGLEELKTNIQKNIEHEKEHKSLEKAEREILEKIVATTTFGDIPEMLIKNEAETMLREIEHEVSHQGLKFEDYLTSIHKTRAQITLDFMPEALKRVKASLIIKEIAKVEKMEVTAKELEVETEHLLKHEHNSPEATAQARSQGYQNYLRSVLMNQKVIQKLKELNIKK